MGKINKNRLCIAGNCRAVVRPEARLSRAASVTDTEVRSVDSTCCWKLSQRNWSKPSPRLPVYWLQLSCIQTLLNTWTPQHLNTWTPVHLNTWTL